MHTPPSQLIAARYALLEPIGHGSNAEVYLGRDLHTGGLVAIKRLRPEVRDDEPAQQARFAREAEALRRLEHPAIVKLLDAPREGGERYLVLEYVAGGSLADRLRQAGQLPLAQVLALARPLADGLDQVHRLNIIHRDIKPSNVLLASDGSPRLTDFGAALVRDRTRLTEAGALIGTLAFLSPEVINGEEPDYRADIWSFGVLLYQLFAGSHPWGANRPVELLTAILGQPAPDVRQANPAVPATLATLIAQMLSKNRDERIPSMRLVVVELGRVLRNDNTMT